MELVSSLVLVSVTFHVIEVEAFFRRYANLVTVSSSKVHGILFLSILISLLHVRDSKRGG
jgi:hypothetical protein